MNLEIITKEDLQAFGSELLNEIKKIIRLDKPVKKKYIRGHEVRKLLGISQGTLQNLRLNGTLPYSKIGSIYFYLHDTVEELMIPKPNENDIVKEFTSFRSGNDED
ncbi:helix-turn-helix domain-containing protein [Pedobacter miscanthi]|uniref:helix-turn-helix domain-containing protein n=1 Tax=Pedobacter miscanthi TaxID=2259170 RepID=UPI001ABEEA81|nr:helix-turn-helix domain-containing protein [Pedobacter miscanthi]